MIVLDGKTSRALIDAAKGVEAGSQRIIDACDAFLAHVRESEIRHREEAAQFAADMAAIERKWGVHNA